MRRQVRYIIQRLSGVYIFLILALLVQGQKVAPASYTNNSGFYSYVRVWDAVKPDTARLNFNIHAPMATAKMSTVYIDGLGKTLQTVTKQGAMATGDSATDLVAPVDYDEFGREPYKYMPFASNNTGGIIAKSDGSFKINAFQQDSGFCKSLYPDENWIYNQSSIETSSLGRVTESFAPGNSWVGTSGQALEANRHSVKVKSWFNKTADSVRIWSVTDVAGKFGAYTTSAFYLAGKLYKTVIVDVHGKQAIEFKTPNGLVILKRVQLTAASDTGTGKGYSGWLSTYYIYDSIGRLRCVIQPRGVELLLASNWPSPSSSGGWGAVLDEQCFRYEYDAYGRINMRKVPGSGELWMVYDTRDRLIMMQDSILRVDHKWMYMQYENNLNRPFATGLIIDNNNLSYHAARADTSYNYPKLSDYTSEELTHTFYDDYNWRSSYSNPLSATYNTKYDTYLLTASNTTWPYPQTNTQSEQIRGLATGTRTKVLGSSAYLYSVSLYDEKSRIIQVQADNITGDSTDIATTQYSWIGQPVLSIQKHKKSNPNTQTIVSLTKPTYDSLWRVTKIEKKVSHSQVNSDAMPGSWKTIVDNYYDDAGQLRKKVLAPAFASGGLDSLKYEYNIRGWMLGMNRSYVKDTASTINYFGFDLGYDKTDFLVNGNTKSYTAVQYNGNIGGMLWKSAGDDHLRKYDFTYDAINRLTAANFNQLTNNSFSKSAGIDFSVDSLTYDANGNILKMNQKGWKLGGSVTIDALEYTYNTGSNKLLNVIDKQNDVNTKLGDFRSSSTYMTSLGSKTTSATDYMYDGNGNLTVDNNKDITFIHYNHLNLPDSIVVAGKGNIKYVYDAGGVKLKKITTDTTHGGKATTTLYLFGNYVNDTLQFIGQEEGHIRYKQGDTLMYDYFIKDHLGNVRMMLTEQHQTDMYPAATMETATATTEETFYNNLSSTRIAVPTGAGYPANTPSGNAQVAKVSGASGQQKIGPAITLRVMAGDKFNVSVNSWWKSTNTPSNTGNPLTDLVSALNSTIGGISGVHGGATATELQTSNVLSPSATNFLNSQSYTSGRPKAYINWILFDEQFNYVSSSSGFEQVGASNAYTTHTRTNLPVDKNGYLYIYVSNITDNIDVFFDNLQVTHVRGPVLEEIHYYPFGLTMTGISSKASSFVEPLTKEKFNDGSELNSDFDISLYETTFRGFDPQIGRWLQIDPLADNYKGWSPYIFALNNPVLLNDPTGLVSKMPEETSTPDKPKLLPEVVVTGVRRKNRNPTIDLISRSPTVMEDIIKEVPWSLLTKLSGEKIDKFFVNYVNKHPEHYRYLAGKYIDMRWAQHGTRIIGAGEIYDAMVSFLDYGLAAADNELSPLPDPTGLSSMIAADLSADLDQSVLSQALTLAARGVYTIEGLGRVFISLKKRGHSIPMTGTYVSAGELLSVFLNGGIVNPNLLMFKDYGFTDTAPWKEGVHYNHFILYNNKSTLPIIEK